MRPRPVQKVLKYRSFFLKCSCCNYTNRPEIEALVRSTSCAFECSLQCQRNSPEPRGPCYAEVRERR